MAAMGSLASGLSLDLTDHGPAPPEPLHDQIEVGARSGLAGVHTASAGSSGSRRPT